MGRASGHDQVFVGRAELVLARADTFPLRAVPLDPDPLTDLVRAMGSVRADLGERAEVVVDLLAVTAGERRRRRRDAVAAERDQQTGPPVGAHSVLWGDNGAGNWRGLLYGDPAKTGRGGGITPRVMRPPPGTIAAEERRREHKAVSAKVLGHEPAFWLQLLLRTQSTVKGREAALLQELISGFSAWAGENYLRAAGRRIGPWFVGADSIWRRHQFDRRWASGLHSPARRQLVGAGEIAGLLKPPTSRCQVENVARSGGVIPPPPRELPTYRGQPDLIPLGWVAVDGLTS